MTGQITWSENRATGNGELLLQWDTGDTESVEWDDPITAATDSHDIVNQFDDNFVEVTHDRDTVFVHTA